MGRGVFNVSSNTFNYIFSSLSFMESIYELDGKKIFFSFSFLFLNNLFAKILFLSPSFLLSLLREREKPTQLHFLTHTYIFHFFFLNINFYIIFVGGVNLNFYIHYVTSTTKKKKEILSSTKNEYCCKRNSKSFTNVYTCSATYTLTNCTFVS